MGYPEGQCRSDAGALTTLSLNIEMPQGPLCNHNGSEEHGIGFGQMGFHCEEQGAAKEQPGQPGGVGIEQHFPEGRGQQGSQSRSQEGWDAVRPDLMGPDHVGCGHRCRLKPVNANRLFMPRLILKADAHEVATFKHLAGGLSEARFVSVRRRQCRQPRPVQNRA